MSFRRSPLLHIAIVLFLGLLVYSNIFDAPFALDDFPNIVENPFIRQTSNIPSMFAGGMGPFASRPLMNATLALNYYFGGLDPRGYHAVNLALHLINGVLLYFLAVMTGRLLRYTDEGARTVALLASALFVAHPVQTEAVTYTVSRSMLFVTTFYLSGIMLYAKAATAERRKKLYITGLFIVSLLGAASRENFITFPIMLILYDLFFISGLRAKAIQSRWKLYIPAMFACIYLIYLALNSTYDIRETYADMNISPFKYILTQLNVHWTYLRLLALPAGQNLDYDYPIAKTLFEFPTVLSFVSYIGLWAGAVLLARRKSPAAFGVLWFLATLLPISFMLVLAGTVLDLKLGDVIFEHRLYLPSLGIIIAIVSGMAMFSERNRKARKSVLVFFTIVSLAFSVVTYMRNNVWQSSISLWEDAVLKSPNKSRPQNNLGTAYMAEGLTDEAIKRFIEAKRLDPSYPHAYHNLGYAYMKKGLVDKAIFNYRAAIAINPLYAKAYSDLGNAYLQNNLIDEAIECLETANRIAPLDAIFINNLGVAYMKKGHIDKAIESFKTAIKTDFWYAGAYNNLGIAYGHKGLYDKAIKYLEKAVEIDPQYAQAYSNLGVIYMRKGLNDKAVARLKTAIAINPRYASAHRNLGEAYVRKGMHNDAQRHFSIAESLGKAAGSPDPDSRDAADSPGLK